jgi:hypothetical protein
MVKKGEFFKMLEMRCKLELALTPEEVVKLMINSAVEEELSSGEEQSDNTREPSENREETKGERTQS